MIEFADRVAKLVATNQHEAATHLVESVASTQPAQHALGLAVLALFGKDAAAAAHHAGRALELGAGAVAHQYLAMASLMNGDPAAAIEQANRAVSLDATHRSRAGLGSVLLAAGRPEEAVPVLRRVVTEQPKDSEALLNLASASAQLSDYGEAITFYARAFDANPADQRPIQNLIVMFAELGKWLGAMGALEMSRKGTAPPEVAVTLDLVMLHLVRLISNNYPQQSAAPEADAAVDNAVKSAARRSPAVQLIVARTLIDVGRFDAATRLIGNTERQPLDDTSRASLRYVQGLLAERGGDKPRALALYLEAQAGDPSRIDAAVNAVSLLLDQGTPEAFAQIDGVLAQVPAELRGSSPELMFNESVYLSRTERPVEAKAQLERIVRLTRGEGRVGERARLRLAELGKGS